MGLKTIKERAKRISSLQNSLKLLTDKIAKLIVEQEKDIFQEKSKFVRKCNGDPVSHQCEKRKCPHRKLHYALKPGDCGREDDKGHFQHWCTCPGTTSLLDGDTDGSVVECVPV